MVYALNVKFSLKPDRRAEFLKLIIIDQEQTLKTEPGALQFVVGEDEETPNTFYLHEEYKSKEDFEYHKSTSHFAKFDAFMQEDPLIDSPVVEFYTLFGPAATKEPIPVRAAYCLNIKVKANPERREEFLEAILQNQAGSIKEPKCLQFQIGESEDTPGVFHFHEEYEDKEGFFAHKESEHFAIYRKFSWSENAVVETPVGSKYMSIFEASTTTCSC